MLFRSGGRRYLSFTVGGGKAWEGQRRIGQSLQSDETPELFRDRTPPGAEAGSAIDNRRPLSLLYYCIPTLENSGR
jgi:hypothetical protein